ncbi:hypothetical protein C5748_09785 [Phyllobacterium phragmitis]|uniref:Uncharacterized protein n=1 Tax=Phyllobacterium phragmitis TaxID=2670329 RepID=A0A2S9ISR4_9HYPH|nr:hypothetical protein C5748_09785 [Phyllobacterium phragmitis]
MVTATREAALSPSLFFPDAFALADMVRGTSNRIDRPAVLYERGKPPSQALPGGGRASPAPSNSPTPGKGWSTPFQTFPIHNVAALVGAADYLSLTVHFAPATPASRTSGSSKMLTHFGSPTRRRWRSLRDP